LLHALLEQIAPDREPFVLVGHSLGGLYSLTYARLYPHDLSALVLLDPAHPQQLWRLPAPLTRRTLDQVDGLTQALPFVDFAASRAIVSWRTESALHRLPPEVMPAVVHVLSQHVRLDRAAQEYRAWPSSSRQSRPENLADLPLLVISCSDRAQGDREANLAWWELHRGLASLSSRGRWEVIPQTSHQSLIMKQAAASEVVARIQALEMSGP
jgi:pimeloyl-ACP methyl ester carboxylesterase